MTMIILKRNISFVRVLHVLCESPIRAASQASLRRLGARRAWETTAKHELNDWNEAIATEYPGASLTISTSLEQQGVLIALHPRINIIEKEKYFVVHVLDGERSEGTNA